MAESSPVQPSTSNRKNFNLFSGQWEIPRPNVSFGVWESSTNHARDPDAEHQLYQSVYIPELDSSANLLLVEEQKKSQRWKRIFYIILIILILLVLVGVIILIIYLVNPCLLNIRCPPPSNK